MMSGAGPAGGALSRRQTSKGSLTEPTLPLPSRATPRELLKPAYADSRRNASMKLFPETLQKLCVYLRSDERVENLMNYVSPHIEYVQLLY
ncbi:unnamed protein product [Euphydryas editha]|uniref:Uncharacterized protein n=1 Tax=Euphydryas editha TaxID=104508 RepID=A0AAU9V2U9_EUPED|nr:unnamed protein product [Euphydryas editha]